MTPAGKPASSATFASIIPAETGANSDGLTTTVFPAATGDMTARQDRTLVPCHGVKLATTPSGRRTPMEWDPGRIGFQNLAFGQIYPACDLLEGCCNQVLLERRMKWSIRFHAPALQRSRFGGA